MVQFLLSVALSCQVLLNLDSLLNLTSFIKVLAYRLGQIDMAHSTNAGVLGSALPAHARPGAGSRAELLEDRPMDRAQFLRVRVIGLFHEELRRVLLFRLIYELLRLCQQLLPSLALGSSL